MAKHDYLVFRGGILVGAVWGLLLGMGVEGLANSSMLGRGPLMVRDAGAFVAFGLLVAGMRLWRRERSPV